MAANNFYKYLVMTQQLIADKKKEREEALKKEKAKKATEKQAKGLGVY